MMQNSDQSEKRLCREETFQRGEFQDNFSRKYWTIKKVREEEAGNREMEGMTEACPGNNNLKALGRAHTLSVSKF